ncbi:phage portal protein [Oharaeibacter diazotrophicus]|uniref:Uncharacterized protein n=2 Tax=Oharaeibacter diazotrophicus TaxID=1920512 RepID=A0A4R6RAG8_9HYPH|nr:phage portal protein [Oharaeibacter diazotrophicus]TDP82637.1 hypothetical protein EDD54_3906 [Oharaeibacter diazotrophicus]BBE72599.1 hypothetical protein OHA_1_02197 [Pleomorphomonas sp. SM30]GLS76633.1 hypothetical protein GCM10007904_19700 [Oharaeibacter diazotrophicus]
MRAAATLAVLAALTSAAAAADLAAPGAGVAEAGIPACDDAGVLSTIVARQNAAERDTWHDGVRIAAVDAPRQSYPGVRFVSAIAHRHCVATAVLGPRRHDRLYYVISARQGFASLGWGVEFCLPRQDYYRVYDADCRVLK